VAALPDTARATDLYERYASRLYGYCLHRLGSREEAEDAVQTTFLNAFRGLSRGVVPASESAWLFKIAENVCLSRHRATFRRRRVEAPADLTAVEDTVAAPARADEELIPLEEALADMPEAQRRALLLREWQGLSYREIAAELEVSQSAVETLIFRARRSLARRLEAPRERLRRVGQAIDVGAALSALKGALSTGAALKAVVAGVAVTGLVAGMAEDRPQPRRHDAPASHAPAPTPSKPQAVRVARPMDAPRRAFAPPAQPRLARARPKARHVTAANHSAPRRVPPAAPHASGSKPTASHPAATPPPPASASVEPSSSETEPAKPHEQQTTRAKPTGKPEATKPKQPDPAPKPKAEEDQAEQADAAEPPAEKGPPADPGSPGEADGKGEERR
jgi:RNA polymerase sigma factor (sigma-70 family)